MNINNNSPLYHLHLRMHFRSLQDSPNKLFLISLNSISKCIPPLLITVSLYGDNACKYQIIALWISQNV
jgi:hypothetical protein